MASLRRAAINIHRVINANKRNITASTTPLTSRPLYGYSKISPFTSYPQSYEIDLSTEESKRRSLNRLLYRSKQRGFLELDLVLGKWVEDNIHSLDENRIKSLIHVLDLENPDLWKWLSGQEQPPESISANPVFAAIKEKLMKNLDSHAAPEVRAMPGQPWVRGWDDIKKGPGGPVTGNQ
ncbi:succinate dehydrogenase assembly factor 2, mitochondrial [Lotus japonicus]|uniref:Succinate dehydrogenase assembly factor 2, mitochondrial n=1 Tax=Lotus japonicus TaxID=34305 RepID=I3SWR2_LOTJA|nr:succinate dehydrogenase assembly factor 2, mitochondrial [Lotus japonicus]AFK44704.1 unknown [Lotus japonicus]